MSSYSAPHVAFNIGNFPVHTYALTMMFGMICSILTMAYFWKRQKYSWEHLQILILIIVPSAILGARLWHVIYAATDKVNYPHFVASRDWYKIWEGGLAIQGGVIASSIAAIFYVITKRKSLDLRTACDYILPAILIGQAIGRWGNFANQEIYGKVVTKESLWWLMPSIREHMHIDGKYRSPLFLYESISSIIGYVIIVWIFNLFNWQKPGATTGGYLVYYGVVRLIMEPLREAKDAMMWGSLNAGIFITSIYIVLGSMLILYSIFDKQTKAFIKCLTNKNLKYKQALKNEQPKYIRVKVSQRYFFIIWPLKIYILMLSLFSSIFAKGKVKLVREEKNKKIQNIKNNNFIYYIKRIIIWFEFSFNLFISSTFFKKMKNKKIKEFSKMKCTQYKFYSHIWVRRFELDKYK